MEISHRVTEPLLACEPVLAETALHLRSSEVALAFVRDGLVRPALAVTEHVQRLAALARLYALREPGLADLCLIRLSELYPEYPVITTDRPAFQIYRRGKRGVIPLITPPRVR